MQPSRKESDWLIPDWPAPANVRALTTYKIPPETPTKIPPLPHFTEGGEGRDPFNKAVDKEGIEMESSFFQVRELKDFNLAAHVGDDPNIVLANRKLLKERANLPNEPLWLNQVHGITVAEATGDLYSQPPKADASVSFEPNQVCVVLTADCLPILLCDKAGTRIGAVHAGWRGLAAGILEAAVLKLMNASSIDTVSPNTLALNTPSNDILAWLGPAIGPSAFEVGEDVLLAFKDSHDAQSFVPISNGKWLADLYQLARYRLERLGVTAIFGGNFCTYSEAERFYSFRRSNQTGRMATLIWRI